jgi:hypothetical protein
VKETFRSTKAFPIPMEKSMSSRVKIRVDVGESEEMWNAGISHTHPSIIYNST